MQLSEQDLTLIAQTLQANFTLEELEDSGYLDRQPTEEVRRELADLDFLFFCRFYLPAHFYLPSAAIHKDLSVHLGEILNTVGPTHDAIAWPRGHSKTTLVSLGLPLYCVAPSNPRVHYTVLIADSHDQSKKYLSTVKEEIGHNARLAEDYGQRRGPVWQSDHIETDNRACIEALGRGMKIRGRKYLQWRPGLIVCDDLEEIARTVSPTNREADAEWLARSVMKAGGPECKLFVIGTKIHHDSVLARLLQNPMFRHRSYRAVVGWADRQDLWEAWARILTDLNDGERQEHAREFYKANEAEMLEGTEVAWPERYSYYDLMVMRVTGEGLTEGSSFSAEMQNEPIDPSLRFFKHLGRYHQEWRPGTPGSEGDTWLVPASGRPAVPLSACAVFGAIDPSLGEKKATTDPCAITTLAKAPTGQMFVLESLIEWLSPDQMISTMNELGLRYAFQAFGVEAVQFQYLFAQDAAKSSAQANVYLPIEPVKQTANKQLRIQAMQPDLHNEYLLLPEFGCDMLVEQLEMFPLAGHDDGPDSLEIARRLAKGWQGEIAVASMQTSPHTFGQEHKVAHASDPYAPYDRLADAQVQQIDLVREILEADARARAELEQEAPPGKWPWYPKIR